MAFQSRVIQGDDDESSVPSNSSSYNEDNESFEGLKQAHSSSGGDSTSGNMSNIRTNNDDSKKTIRANLSKAETFKVNVVRVFVLTILLLAATSICVVVYFISKNSEQEQFQSQYEGIATKVLDIFRTFASRTSAIYSVSIMGTVVGYDTTTNTTRWPFVTIPSFEHSAAAVFQLSFAHEITVYPLVTSAQRTQWEKYSVSKDKYWIQVGLEYQATMGLDGFEVNCPPIDQILMTNFSSMPIVRQDPNGSYVTADTYDLYLPKWQSNPVLKNGRINVDIYNHDYRNNTNIGNRNVLPAEEFKLSLEHPNRTFNDYARNCIESRKAVVGSFALPRPGTIYDTDPFTARMATLRSFDEKKVTSYNGSAFAMLYLPIYNSFETNRQVVGVVTAMIRWREYFPNMFPPNVKGVVAIIENTCDGNYTFEINGDSVRNMGSGDLHDPKYTKYGTKVPFQNNETITDGTKEGLSFNKDTCQYNLHVFPSDTLVKSYQSATPIFITLAVAMVFAFAICMFLVYNYLVEKRQRIILNKAAHSTAIVSSLFPKQVRDRLLEDDDNDGKNELGSRHSNHRSNFFTSGGKLKHYLSDQKKLVNETRQIADLFPNCTVMFADIAGFSAWSSTRGPESVFALLQTLYQGFDRAAKKRNVFKVETIGDCYLAVTGLPDPQPKHAIIMARFAWECRETMYELMKDLESQLGPDCSDLRMRIGLHSGPVTAGVLRGERARFQLFGDTVNTAARMESTGVADLVQVSQATADLLVKEGKGHWIRQRERIVEAKGKGLLRTYWMNPNFGRNETSTTNTLCVSNDDCKRAGGRMSYEHANNIKKEDEFVRRDRMVDWMADLLLDHIKKMRHARGVNKKTIEESPTFISPSGSTCLDEVKEVIELCNYKDKFTTDKAIELPDSVRTDLRNYLLVISNLYLANPFHNFEHACHVTMSVSKLLCRIVSPEISDEDVKEANKKGDGKGLEECLHNFTYGINSDPLLQFSVVFAAIVHDLDHRGCSNARLIIEEQALGTRYKNKSVAEQNSFDLAWNLLMSSQFASLRYEIFGTQEELLRFRQFLVNVILATDIFDKELNDLRRARWEKAFSEQSNSNSTYCNSDIKATIVLEHIIQASDVSHTMQHWQVYQKWNRRLFKEMYLAYHEGRMAADPSTFWYKGEISFFDNYVIPLARKLKDCNVFGVSSDEYLNYAVSNRLEWEERGESILEEMMNEFVVL